MCFWVIISVVAIKVPFASANFFASKGENSDISSASDLAVLKTVETNRLFVCFSQVFMIIGRMQIS